ncbi:MAG: MaoC family dehydratase [Boseongicola sp. SB0662_bin_57]|nr:MaoC family dehydratase [Boseongicola sp. SB0662_bin_57]
MRLLPPGHHGAATLKRGDRVDCGFMTITAEMIDAFADMTGDRFEIHVSDEAARRHGFDAKVAHGLLVLSLIDGLKNRAPAQFRARASLDWQWSFHLPVLAGDRIAVTITIAAINRARQEDQAVLVLDFDVTNQDGKKVQSGINRLLAYR